MKLTTLGKPILGAALFAALICSPLTRAADYSFTGTGLATITESGTGLGNSNSTNVGLQYSIAIPQGGTYPLMRFDLSSLAGQTITANGTLTLTVNSGIWPGNTLTPTLSLFMLNHAYDPNTVTLDNYGGHAATALDTQTPTFTDVDGDRATGQTVNFSIAASVLQSWANSASTNFGLFLEESDYFDFVGHSDIQWGDASSLAPAPQLSVSAVPEPETYAMMLAGLALLGLRARRRNQPAA